LPFELPAKEALKEAAHVLRPGMFPGTKRLHQDCVKSQQISSEDVGKKLVTDYSHLFWIQI
jgi:hypothetical protein